MARGRDAASLIFPSLWRSLTAVGAAVLFALGAASAARAFQIDTGVPELKLIWDNTLKYSAAVRVSERSDKLVEASENPSTPNLDDGDRNFSRGLISNRLDLFSEFDAVYDRVGFRVSGAAWYDLVYNRKNDNDSAATANAASVSNDEFTDETEELHGKNVELLDAFAFGSADVGITTTSVRAGQFAMQWGESLFFGNNGIAGGMAPIDVVKLLSVPNSQFKEIIRPVPQVSAQVQIGSMFSVGGYYQLRWEESVIPASGSYFSSLDIVGEGAERLFVPGPPGAALYHRGDEEARDSGQAGVQLRVRPGLELDLGFYAIRYHDKVPQIYLRPGLVANPADPAGPPVVVNPSVLDPANPTRVGDYSMVYPEDIQAYGMSATKTFGGWNLATEVSMRRNAPLVSDPQVTIPATPGVFPGVNPSADNSDDPAYAVGNTLHAQFNWFAILEPNFLSNESQFLGEVAWNRRLSITDNESALDPNTTRDAWGFRMMYEPTYRQVLPAMDVSIPLGFAYFPKGTSSTVGNFGPDKGGDMSIGLNVSYLDAWRFSLSYLHFYGPSAAPLDKNQYMTFKQSLADRDFVSFSVRRTF